MKIIEKNYLNMTSFNIENDMISIHVLPELGCKIASLFYKPQNFEILAQPSNKKYQLPNYNDSFALYDTSGADEMYPAIDASIYPWPEHEEHTVPDHGELWSIPWQCSAKDEHLHCSVQGKVFPYEFQRRMKLYNNTLELSYCVHNLGHKPLHAFWAFHGLVACDAASILDLPNITLIENVHDHSILGSRGTIHSYPETLSTLNNQSYRFDKIKPMAANTTSKFYVAGAITEGLAAISLNNNRLRYELQFSTDELPYLGIWVNEGGFKGEYNIGIEPSDGYYDSLTIAKEKGLLKPLQPHETKSWQLKINLHPIIS